MTYAAMYNRICHLLDVQYDVMSRVTTVGNALPAVAFPSRDRHTAVFTGQYLGPEGPDTRYTGISGTRRSWLCYHRDICIKPFILFNIPFISSNRLLKNTLNLHFVKKSINQLAFMEGYVILMQCV